MTAYYVDSAGDNSDGLTWAKAFTTFAGAVAAATESGDIIYVDQGFTNTLAADSIFTFNNHISVICSNDKANEPPQTLGVMGTSAWIGHSSTSYSIVLSGAYKVYIYGLTFRIAGSLGTNISIAHNQDGAHFELENCYFWSGNTSSSSPGIRIGYSNSYQHNIYTKLTDCTFRFGATAQYLFISNYCEIVGGSFSAAGSIPTGAIGISEFYTGGILWMTGTNLSAITTGLFRSGGNKAGVAHLSNCQLGSGVTVLATQTPANKGAANVWLYNCSVGDQHYHLAHYDAFGSMIIDTGIYANDGAKYDGTNGCSWKIITTANCSYYTPYVSPWIDCYHSGTSAITPSLEIVRSGSATAYQDDEVWGEFSYQGTSGYPLATVVSDRKDLLASAADQTTGALGASDWTGESGTSWFGKLNPTASITPAEIGHLRARVCVGEPEITVYVDPTIRGRS